MPAKKISILVKSKPFSRINYYEALRLALGLWEHQVSVVWMGDGVYAVLKGADRTLTDQFYQELPGMNVGLFVEEESLKERGLGRDDVVPEVRVVRRSEVPDLLLGSDASLVF